MSDVLQITNLNKSFKVPKEKLDSFQERLLKLKLRTKYRSLKALNNVNLQVEKGEWLGIVGANGSGKSTLLKIIAGILEADQGQVQVNGHLVPFLELGVGFNPELSARDNIYLNGVLLGLTRQQIRQKFSSIVSFSGVKKFIDQKIKNFSSGMQVRLAFAIAIQTSADIYLFDEILSVGDYQFQKKAKLVFNQMKKQNKTALIVSHHFDDLVQYCDRVIWLDQGKIKAQGQPQTVINQYTS